MAADETREAVLTALTENGQLTMGGLHHQLRQRGLDWHQVSQTLDQLVDEGVVTRMDDADTPEGEPDQSRFSIAADPGS